MEKGEGWNTECNIWKMKKDGKRVGGKGKRRIRRKMGRKKLKGWRRGCKKLKRQRMKKKLGEKENRVQVIKKYIYVQKETEENKEKAKNKVQKLT